MLCNYGQKLKETDLNKEFLMLFDVVVVGCDKNGLGVGHAMAIINNTLQHTPHKYIFCPPSSRIQQSPCYNECSICNIEAVIFPFSLELTSIYF